MTAARSHDGPRTVAARPPSASTTQAGRTRRARRGPSPRFLREVDDPAARQDIRTLALFVRIYCDGHHGERERMMHRSDAEQAGTYLESGSPVLCAECSAHLAYGEARRVFCTLDPKPFCAHCEVHCFKDSERTWNRQMMRYSGPRSLLHGYALDGARHLAGSLRLRMRTAWTRIRPVGR